MIEEVQHCIINLRNLERSVEDLVSQLRQCQESLKQKEQTIADQSKLIDQLTKELDGYKTDNKESTQGVS